MVQPSCGFRLAQKSLADVGEDVVWEIRMQRLDSDVTLNERVMSAIHSTHCPAPQLAKDAVATEPSGGHGCSRLGGT